MESAKESLADRYNYKTRFFNDANELKEKIINKTVIPHQVEVQPGRMSGALCWLRCPYCYGKISESKKQSLKDRSKQITIAKKKGLYSPYIKQTVNDL